MMQAITIKQLSMIDVVNIRSIAGTYNQMNCRKYFGNYKLRILVHHVVECLEVFE